MKEAFIEKKLRQGVEALGGSYEHKIVPGRRGHPDGEIVWPPFTVGWKRAGRWFGDKQEDDDSKAVPVVEFAEVKTEGGEFEAGQERDHERRRAMGFEVHVLRGMGQVEAYLRSRGKE